MTVTMECYRVVRDCHNSGGRCVDCIGKDSKVRIVQMDNMTKEKAEQVAKNWREYNATAEPMPNKENEKPELEPLDKVALACNEVHRRILDTDDETLYILKAITLPGGFPSFRFVAEIEIDGETFEVQVRKLKK